VGSLVFLCVPLKEVSWIETQIGVRDHRILKSNFFLNVILVLLRVNNKSTFPETMSIGFDTDKYACEITPYVPGPHDPQPIT
jgi:hypothetical protein